MPYFPIIDSSVRVREYPLPGHRAVLYTDIESAQTIQYYHILLIFRTGETRPCLAVASEWSDDFSRQTPFLGLFPGDGHMNFGTSADWLDLEKFAVRALELAAEHLHLTTPATKPAKPWWKFW